MSGGGRVEITVTGSTAADIRKATEQITATVQGIQGIDHISNNLQDGTKGVAIEVRQKDAAKVGLSAMQASMILRPFLSETNAGRIGDGTKASDLYLSLNGTSVSSVEDIGNLKLNTPTGASVLVKDIADVKLIQLPSTLQFKNGSEFATVTAQITDKAVEQSKRVTRKGTERAYSADGHRV